MTSVSSILERKWTSSENKISEELTTDNIFHMKFTPMTFN